MKTTLCIATTKGYNNSTEKLVVLIQYEKEKEIQIMHSRINYVYIIGSLQKPIKVDGIKRKK